MNNDIVGQIIFAFIIVVTTTGLLSLLFDSIKSKNKIKPQTIYQPETITNTEHYNNVDNSFESVSVILDPE